jgi:hypothetical protein
MSKHWWEVKVVIHDSADKVVAELEGWQLSDTTLDKIQSDVDAVLEDIENE